MRGFFEIGVYKGKTEANIGTLWRSAYQLGASGIFVIGPRYKKQASDTEKAWRHIPLRSFNNFDEFRRAIPMDTIVVGVELTQTATALPNFKHPERAMYLLGAEDHGLPDFILGRCHRVVSVPSIRRPSFNVAVAGSVVMYDRVTKNGHNRIEVST